MYEIGDYVEIKNLSNGDLITIDNGTWIWLFKIDNKLYGSRFSFTENKTIVRELEKEFINSCAFLNLYLNPKNFLLKRNLKSISEMEEFLKKSSFPYYDCRLEVVLCEKFKLQYNIRIEDLIKEIRKL